MSDSYWRGHFGSDPSVLNQQIKINGSAFTIVGIVRHEGLMDAAPSAVFVPISMQQAVVPGKENFLNDPLHRWLNIVGRLSPGVTRAQAEVELNTFWWNWRRDVLKTKSDSIDNQKDWLATHLSVIEGGRGIPLFEGMFGEPLKILQAMALVVLLIACSNVTNLLLAKAARKHDELAVRGALGASRQRIFQQVISEGLLLGVMGSVTGLLLGCVSLKLLFRMVPATNTLARIATTYVDWRAVAFCISAGFLTSITFSIVPALLSTRVDLVAALHRQSGTISPGNKLRNLLVTGAIALSLALLSGAIIFGWNLYELRNINPGFATNHMLTFRVDVSMLGKSGPQIRNEYASIQNGILRDPEVHNVAYSAEGLIAGGEMGNNITVAGYTGQDDEPPNQNWITPGFFSTLQVPLLAGREFTQQDTAASQRVAIVDQAFVKHYFGGSTQNALGGHFHLSAGNKTNPEIQIVGIIPTIRATSLTNSPSLPFLYLPYDQTYGSDGSDARSHPASFYLSTSGDPARLAGAVRQLVHQIDGNLPIVGLETMEEHLSGVIFEKRIVTMLSFAMGGLALVLAAIGLYSLLAFIVTQRTHEIGIRMTLGADRQHVSTLIAKQVSGIVLTGITVGALLGWAGMRLLVSRDVSLAHAPLWLFVLTGTLLLGLMSLAALLPARRAASIDPMHSLRAE